MGDRPVALHAASQRGRPAAKVRHFIDFVIEILDADRA